MGELAIELSSVHFSLVQLFATPWTAAHQASLSITNSRSLPKLTSLELVMPSNHLILSHPLLLPSSVFPSIRVFSNESALNIRWPSIGVSASASVLSTENKTQIPPQPIPSIRKLSQASYPYSSEGRQNENYNHRKLIKLMIWTTDLSNSMKL